MDQVCKQSSEDAKSMKRIEGIHFTVERFRKLKIVKWQMTKLTASSKTILYSPRIFLGRSGNSVPLYFYILKSLLFTAFLQPGVTKLLFFYKGNKKHEIPVKIRGEEKQLCTTSKKQVLWTNLLSQLVVAHIP